MNKIFLANLFVFFLLFASCTEEDKVEPIVTNPTPNPPVTEPSTPINLNSTSQVKNRITGLPAGTSTVERTEDSISISLEANDLIPGHVYILVVTTVDRPENCQTSPCTVLGDFVPNQGLVASAGFQPIGLVADSSSVTFKVTIREKDNTTVPMFTGQFDQNVSLQDALKAEVHLSVRSKGPELVAHSEEQRTDVTTRCTKGWNYGASNAQIPMEEGECAWLLESSHLAPQ